jgi:hypothetical protein
MKSPIITLLTDFGSKDPYVGVMKGVILSICPGARLVDLSHEVPPQQVASASYLLKSVLPYFPEGTVHLAVVDPGVGGARKAAALASEGRFFVGPDNGLFPAALGERGIEKGVEITEKAYRLPGTSPTFHGRDIFAPAAAHLAAGLSLGKLGPKCSHWVWRELPRPRRINGGLEGEILWVDGFGNLVTNFQAPYPDSFRLKVGKVVVKKSGTHYAEVKVGEALVLPGSSGHLEVSVNGGRADVKLKAGIGMKVVLEIP